nr:hypothetical protein [Micromonospora sp. M71_S20]
MEAITRRTKGGPARTGTLERQAANLIATAATVCLWHDPREAQRLESAEQQSGALTGLDPDKA